MKFVKARNLILSTLMIAGLVLSLSPAASAQVEDILMVDIIFLPNDLTINVVTTVRWTNIDPILHTTTSDGNWDSGALAEGETFEFTFNSAGTFNYVCSFHPTMTGTITVQQPTAVEDEVDFRNPSNFSLGQNYPNPFNPSTNISFTLARRAEVSLEVFTVLGTKVKSIADGEFQSGNHTVTWDGTDNSGRPVASGIYFYSMKAGDFIATEKMLLLK